MKLTLIAAAAVPLALAACSSPPAGSSTATPSPVTAASPAASVPTPAPATPAPAASPQASSDPDAPGRIGGAAKALPGGVTVTVGKPTRHAVSAAVGGGPGSTRTGDQVAVFPVTITSTGKTPIALINTDVRAYASGEQLDGLSDGDIPADNHFSGTLMPGKTMEATWAFVLRKTDTDLQVEVYVGEQGASHGIFTSGDGTT